jgi:hypothetical protein
MSLTVKITTDGGNWIVNEGAAKAERARLQTLLDAYEADRQRLRVEGERHGTRRELSPDRAANVRARIDRLNQIIGDNDSN